MVRITLQLIHCQGNKTRLILSSANIQSKMCFLELNRCLRPTLGMPSFRRSDSAKGHLKKQGFERDPVRPKERSYQELQQPSLASSELLKYQQFPGTQCPHSCHSPVVLSSESSQTRPFTSEKP